MATPKHLLFSTLILIFLATSTAQAAINKKGAKELKTMFEDILDYSPAAAGLPESSTLKLDGDVTVEQAGSYYAVTLPHISLVSTDGSRTDVGMVALNVLPTKKDGQWKMTMAIPTPITHYDADGKWDMTIAIEQQNFAGIWHKKFKNFTKLNARYKNVTINTADKSFHSLLPDTTILYDLKENDTGNWSGPVDFSVNNMQMTLDEGEKITIGKIKLQTTMTDYSFEEAVAYQEKIDALMESYGSGEGSESGSHIMGIYNLVSSSFGSVLDSFTIKMGIQDLLYTEHRRSGLLAEEFRIDNASMGFSMNGLRQDKSSLRTSLNYSGLSISPSPEDWDTTTPDHMNFDISINNLPFKELAELGRGALDSALTMPGMAQMAGLQALMMAPQILTKAQTNLTLNDTVFGTEDYDVQLNAILTADLSATLSAVGEARGEIYGLEKWITILNRQLDSLTSPENDTTAMAKYSDVLSKLKKIGKQEKDKKGRPVHVYNFKMDKQGQTLLNGSDIKTLLQPETMETPAK